MIPVEAVEAAKAAIWDLPINSIEFEWQRDMVARAALEAATPYMLASKVAEARANNDHIVEGGDGYSAGFHYALHCIEGEQCE